MSELDVSNCDYKKLLPKIENAVRSIGGEPDWVRTGDVVSWFFRNHAHDVSCVFWLFNSDESIQPPQPPQYWEHEDLFDSVFEVQGGKNITDIRLSKTRAGIREKTTRIK